MIKVITYGTYDFLHFGHINLLKRAKALGDYLIVGVTADDFDRRRGKINVQQSLEERIAAVQATGLADQIIIEEYEGQKIDDIRRYEVDIFTVGSDWMGYFDYINEYCKVVYLPRTQGVSSTDIRKESGSLNLGLVGYSAYLKKIYNESKFVNGLIVKGVYTHDTAKLTEILPNMEVVTEDYDELLTQVDGVFIHSHPSLHYEQIKKALSQQKHVLCESPLCESEVQCKELFQLAEANGCVLMDGLKTAYAVAYARMLLLLKSGKIGDVISVDATCTSLRTGSNVSSVKQEWDSISAWGTFGMLATFQILGTSYKQKQVVVKCEADKEVFTDIQLMYEHAVAHIKAGTGVKSEGCLIVSGTKGYLYVPSPWWNTNYFELRYEDPTENKRYFYQMDGEGIRYGLIEFLHAIQHGKADFYLAHDISIAIAKVIEETQKGLDTIYI